MLISCVYSMAERWRLWRADRYLRSDTLDHRHGVMKYKPPSYLRKEQSVQGDASGASTQHLVWLLCDLIWRTKSAASWGRGGLIKPPMVSCSAWGNQCTTETEVQQTVSIFKSDHLNGLAHIWNCSCYCSIHMGETGDLHWILMFLALKSDLQNCPLGTNKVFSISPLIWSLTSPDQHYSNILAIDRGQDKKGQFKDIR